MTLISPLYFKSAMKISYPGCSAERCSAERTTKKEQQRKSNKERATKKEQQRKGRLVIMAKQGLISALDIHYFSLCPGGKRIQERLKK